MVMFRWLRVVVVGLVFLAGGFGCYPPPHSSEPSLQSPSTPIDGLSSTDSSAKLSHAADSLRVPATGDPSLLWEFRDIDVVLHQPWSHAETKLLVVVFVAVDCPIANYFQPTLARIESELDARVQFVQIHSDMDTTDEVAREHARDFEIQVPVVLDQDQAWANRLDAKVTPEAFLVDRSGNVLYRGRINDLFTDYGKRRAAPTREDLQEAIRAALEGRPIELSNNRAIGCLIDRKSDR